MAPVLSIVVLSDRPRQLDAFLHMLDVQTRQDFEIVILDQCDTDDVYRTFRDHTNALHEGTKYVRVDRHNDWGQTAKYEAARDRAEGELVCFPNDDAYYVPTFVERMAGAVEHDRYDLVLCNWIFDAFGYVPYTAKPQTGWFDIGGFVAKRALVVEDGWPDRTHEGDGRLVERIVERGARWGTVPGFLYVKN